MNEEEYSIGQVHGFQVFGKNYYSQVFGDFKDAKALKEQLEKTSAVEKVVPMAISKDKVKKNVKK